VALDLDATVITDISALCRVLCNMVTNALEATEPGGRVRIWADEADDRICFSVWNAAEIPAHARLRIFQRNYSTKGGEGRGIGGYSMKLFGENVLGGRVGFESSADGGTTFWIDHPETPRGT